MKTKTRELVLAMAASNGILNRTTTADEIVRQAEEALLPTKDADILEEWLGTLSEDELDTLADGEFTEVLELRQTAPKRVAMDTLLGVSYLIDEMYDRIVEG